MDNLDKTRESARDRDNQYRILLNSLPHRVFYKNHDSIFITVNQAFADDIGVSAEEIVGKSDEDFFPPEVAEKYRDDDRHILASGVTEEFEENYLQQGVMKTIHTVKAPVRNEQQEITGILGVFWDITDRKGMEQALRESEQRYCGLFEDSPVSLWEEDFSEIKQAIDRLKAQGVTDLKGYFDKHPETVADFVHLVKIVDFNRATLDMVHARDKEDLLNNIDKIFAPEVFNVFREELLAIASGQRIFESEGRNRTLDGRIIDINLRWTVAPGYENTLSRVFVSIMDITARKMAEEHVRRQTVKAEALVEVSNALSSASLETQAIYEIITEWTARLIGDACVLTLITDNNTQLSVAAYSHTDPGSKAILGKVLDLGQQPIGDGAVAQAMKTGQPVFIPFVSETNFLQLVPAVYRPFLEQIGVHSLMIIPLVAQRQLIGTLVVSRDALGNPYTLEDQAFLQNLANHATLAIQNGRLHELMKTQAHTDSLTGVCTRRYFLDQSELEFSRSKRHSHHLSAILIDLDRFKTINDTYGHVNGDQALRVVAERCLGGMRATDLIGRYGGDEFSILLPETDLSGAARIADRLRQAVAAAPIETEKGPVTITVSMGLATKTDKIPDLMTLLRLADDAMYVAKRAGGNRLASIAQDFIQGNIEIHSDSNDVGSLPVG